MTGGFQANVPVRKPRTKIARVISELTAGRPEGADPSGDRVVEDAAPPARDAVADASVPRGAAVLTAALIARPSAAPPTARPRI